VTPLYNKAKERQRWTSTTYLQDRPYASCRRAGQRESFQCASFSTTKRSPLSKWKKGSLTDLVTCCRTKASEAFITAKFRGLFQTGRLLEKKRVADWPINHDAKLHCRHLRSCIQDPHRTVLGTYAHGINHDFGIHTCALSWKGVTRFGFVVWPVKTTTGMVTPILGEGALFSKAGHRVHEWKKSNQSEIPNQTPVKPCKITGQETRVRHYWLASLSRLKSAAILGREKTEGIFGTKSPTLCTHQNLPSRCPAYATIRQGHSTLACTYPKCSLGDTAAGVTGFTRAGGLVVVSGIL